MTKQNKVYIVGPDSLTMNMFLMMGWGTVKNPADADLIQFTGGADVSPALYGAAKHATTYVDPRRDAIESDIYYKYHLLLEHIDTLKPDVVLTLESDSSWQNACAFRCDWHYL